MTASTYVRKLGIKYNSEVKNKKIQNGNVNRTTQPPIAIYR